MNILFTFGWINVVCVWFVWCRDGKMVLEFSSGKTQHFSRIKKFVSDDNDDNQNVNVKELEKKIHRIWENETEKQCVCVYVVNENEVHSAHEKWIYYTRCSRHHFNNIQCDFNINSIIAYSLSVWAIVCKCSQNNIYIYTGA